LNNLVTSITGLIAGTEILFSFSSLIDKINTFEKYAESEDSHKSAGDKI